MASAFIALIGSIVAGLATSEGPPDLKTLFHRTSNISRLTTLLSSPTYAGLYSNMAFPETQGTVTILVPNDAAFAKLPSTTLGKTFEENDTATITEILKYHLLKGVHATTSLPNGTFEIVPTWLNVSGVTNGQAVAALQRPHGGSVLTSGLGENSSVIKGDLFFNAGVVHVIDNFLIPPSPLIPTASSFNLTSFVGAVTHASLSEDLAFRKDMTIFAPSNAAFAALGSTLESMSVTELSQLLQYHIVNGTYGFHGSRPFAATVGYNSSLTNGTVLQTLQNGNVTITRIANSTFANSAKVVQSDILIANGVIHVIDDVLDYQATDAKPVSANASNLPLIQGDAAEEGVVPFVQYLPTSASSVVAAMAPQPEAAAQTSGGFDVSDIGKGIPDATLSRAGGIVARATGSKDEDANASASHTDIALATNAGVKMPDAGFAFVPGVLTVWSLCMMWCV